MTVERIVAIRRGIVNGEPVEPPLNESEMVTLVILAEERLRDPSCLHDKERVA